MSRNATASWSGYSHQGKIALLIALRRINALHLTGGNLNDYTLQCETHEDASISHNAVVLEAHQVKAKNGDTTKGSYTGALSLFTVGNDKYLHTTCEITNWNDLQPAENPSGVIRYEYEVGRNYCPLTSIMRYVDESIATLLRNDNHPQAENEPFRTEAMGDFLSLLDDRIRYEHAYKAEVDYDISFSLQDVKQSIIAPDVPTASRIVAIRKRLYETFILFISELDDNAITITAEQEQAVTAAIANIYGLNNDCFLQFLRNINPHTSSGVKLETQILTEDFFVTDNFYSTFLGILIRVTGAVYNLDDKNIPSYFRDDSYLLTAISSHVDRVKHHARKILENPDVDFSAYERDFLVTENYTGSLSSHAPSLFRDEVDNRFMKMKNMKFIKVQDAITTLNAVP